MGTYEYANLVSHISTRWTREQFSSKGSSILQGSMLGENYENASVFTFYITSIFEEIAILVSLPAGQQFKMVKILFPESVLSQQ